MIRNWRLADRVGRRFRYAYNIILKRLTSNSKARILFLVDYRDWAFDHSAKEIAQRLADEFEISFQYIEDGLNIRQTDFELFYIFFWGESRHQAFQIPPEKLVKQVSSHRWVDDPRFGPCGDSEMVKTHLLEAGTITCTSRRLHQAISQFHPRVFHTPNGINISQFHPTGARNGEIKFGWAGNLKDPAKGIEDLIRPAAEGIHEIAFCDGNTPHRAMNRFYNQIDVLIVGSKHEGEPLTLLESMGSGCFPITTDVGIAPELINSYENGIILKNRTIADLRAAFDWCRQNPSKVREGGRNNSDLIRKERSWDLCAEGFRKLFRHALHHKSGPRFRNDDVSGDTDFYRFRDFCEIFHSRGLTQTHGIILRGRTNSNFLFQGNDSVEYDGYPNIGNLDNGTIRRLSQGVNFSERNDLVSFLSRMPDEVAFHGLFHTDHSKMSIAELRSDMEEGLQILSRLFPHKRIQYFIPPFNRISEACLQVCRELGLVPLLTDGVHLEEQLHSVDLKAGNWYRYHHHRFYPESTISYWDLSLDSLRTCLDRSGYLPISSKSDSVKGFS